MARLDKALCDTIRTWLWVKQPLERDGVKELAAGAKELPSPDASFRIHYRAEWEEEWNRWRKTL